MFGKFDFFLGCHILCLAFTTELCVRSGIEGWAPSKTQMFLCFQVIQGMSRVAGARPLRSDVGMSYLTWRHQSIRLSSWSGARAVILSQERTSCQTCRAKGHSNIRWRMDSGAWSQRRHLGWWGRPCRASRSAVQHMSKFASQWKNFTFGGAHVFHISFQEQQGVDPCKVAR